jgi:hypothetical protein
MQKALSASYYAKLIAFLLKLCDPLGMNQRGVAVGSKRSPTLVGQGPAMALRVRVPTLLCVKVPIVLADDVLLRPPGTAGPR